MEYLSASRLKLLSECKKQFYHRYIAEDLVIPDNAFSEMGTAIHYALEKFRENYPKMEKKQLIGIYNQTFNPDSKWSWLKKQGFASLWKLDLNKVVLGELVAVEHPFDFKLDGVSIRGIIDKIELVDDTIVITDYKTNKAIEPEKYFPQLAMYDLAMEQEFPNSKREYELFYVRHNKVVPFRFSEDFHKQTHETAHSVVKYVKENREDISVWTKTAKKESMCNFCPLVKSCWG